MENYYLIPIIAVAMIFTLWIVLYFIPLGAYFTAIVSGVDVSLLYIVMLRFRRIPVQNIVNGLIMANKGGLFVTPEDIERIWISGGNISNVLGGMILAKNAGLELPFNKALSADIKGINLSEAVKKIAKKQPDNDPLFD